MDGNEFDIICSWDWRWEDTATTGQRFVKTLDALSGINPHFGPWSLVDRLNEASIPLDQARTMFPEIADRCASRGDDGKPEPVYGYTVHACNRDVRADTTSFSVELTVRAGGGSQRFQNVSFKTPYNKVADPSIVAYPVFKSVLTTLVRFWNPRSAQVYSSELQKDWDLPRFDFDLDWMVYLSAPLAAKITPPPDAHAERTPDGGVLLISAEETFDTENAAHMAAAKRIRDALAPINNWEKHERDKQRADETERMLKASGFPGVRVTNRRGRPT
jgi:hypothetical protein